MISKGYAVAVLIISPEGIPLVRDPKKPAPVFWKLPGGRSDEGENGSATAIREVQEETGIVLMPESLKVIFEEDRDTHTLIIFEAILPKLPKIKTIGNESEEIKIFKPKEVLVLRDFFPNHRKITERILENL